MLFAQSIALISDVHIGAVIGVVHLPLINIYRIKDYVIMNMVFVDMRC